MSLNHSQEQTEHVKRVSPLSTALWHLFEDAFKHPSTWMFFQGYLQFRVPDDIQDAFINTMKKLWYWSNTKSQRDWEQYSFEFEGKRRKDVIFRENRIWFHCCLGGFFTHLAPVSHHRMAISPTSMSFWIFRAIPGFFKWLKGRWKKKKCKHAFQ